MYHTCLRVLGTNQIINRHANDQINIHLIILLYRPAKSSDFLSKNNIIHKNIKGIIVVNGPGINLNFKVGIVIVNTMGYLLDIPIASVSEEEFKTYEEFIEIGLYKIQKEKKYKPIKPIYKYKNW